MSEINIVELATTGIGAFVIGLLCGAATRYLFRVVAFLAGILIAIVVYLELIDFIAIKWNNINDMATLVIDTLTVLGVPEQETSAEVLNVFSIIGGLVAGFLVGYRFG